jgi:hypothetical protein
MPTTGPRVKTTKPKSLFEKSYQLDFKALFKALSKALTHAAIGKWAEAGNDAVEALCAIGLSTDPGELAFLLVHRSLVKAAFDLVGESVSLLSEKTERDSDALLEHLDFTISTRTFHIDRQFLDRPSTLPLVADIQPLIEAWLEGHGVESPIGEGSRSTVSKLLHFCSSSRMAPQCKILRHAKRSARHSFCESQ